MPLGLESPGFESLTLSGCVSWSEVLREFPCSISPVEIVIPSSKWMAPDKCLMDTAALTRQPPPLPLTSFSTRDHQGGHLLPGHAALWPLWRRTFKEL